MATESDLERQCRLHAQSLGGYLLKIRIPGTRGFHDRLLLLPPGYVAFIEFKHPGGRGRKSAPQTLWQHRLEALAIPAFEISAYADFCTLCHKRGLRQ
jgi:hypothetical protein